MEVKDCKYCLYRRGVGAVAMNEKLEIIGCLEWIDANGTEWWKYDKGS